MAKFWTYAEIRAKIQQDLSLEDEVSIEPAELLGYVNEAIDEAEAEIHGLYEDYFLTRNTITLVQSQEEYDLPADIFAHKIRNLVYKNGSEVYQIHRVKDWRKFEEYAVQSINQTSTRYMWFMVNSVPGSPKVLISPPAKTAGPYVNIWYLRNANRLVLDTDVCDIPEFINFVLQYAKVRCYEKEGHPNLQKAMPDLEQQRTQMVSTLATMTPDGENELEADFSIYEELS